MRRWRAWLFVNAGKVGIGGPSDPQAALKLTGTASIFGAWEAKAVNTVFQAPSDGFVSAYVASGVGTLQLLSDATHPPLTVRAFAEYNGSNEKKTLSAPIRKGDFWQVTGGGSITTVYWLPLGN